LRFQINNNYITAADIVCSCMGRIRGLISTLQT
jgi:hypothetical protein